MTSATDTLCDHCANGSYRGFRRDGRLSTIYFWCEVERTHGKRLHRCRSFAEGTPSKYDKRGELIDDD